VAALKARGRYENTLLMVTADHGELLGEHDQLGHGGRMMYEGLLHIPLVVKLPGADHPRGVRREPVQLVDLVPTVLAVLGAPMAPGVQGQPLLGPVTHPIRAEEDVNPEFVAHYGAVYDRALRVLYDGPYKLIHSSRGERLLFDLATDPGEDHDLAQPSPSASPRWSSGSRPQWPRCRCRAWPPADTTPAEGILVAWDAGLAPPRRPC